MAPQARFEVPSGAAAKVSIIDTTLRFSGLPTQYLLKPPVEGFEKFMNLPSWSFLVESSTGRKVLYDLGLGKSDDCRTPDILEEAAAVSVDMGAEKDTAEILEENGVARGEIESVIWSHHHFDHTGDMTTFPLTTELVVGPGFKKEFGTAYPTDPKSRLREIDWKGRNLREINFDDPAAEGILTVGPFRALDFFGDGSFYLLATPGHTNQHLSGLARTTAGVAGQADTFIFMGGDICHHGGELRPTAHLPLPDAHASFPAPDAALRARLSALGCPGGALFRRLNESRGRAADEPFFDPVLAVDPVQALQSIREAALADAQDHVFFLFAHDTTVRGVIDVFPAPANDWKAKGWREQSLWRFLEDLGMAASKIEA